MTENELELDSIDPAKIDQNQFVENQEQLQAPPEIIQKQQQKALQNQPKKRWPIIILGVIIIILISLVIVFSASQPTQNPDDTVPPTPTPQERSTKVQQELNRLNDLVEDADPNQPAFIPPPVDMKVEF